MLNNTFMTINTSFINYLPSNSVTLGETVTLNGHIKTNIERELQKLLAKATYFVNTEVTRKRRACASHKTGIRKRGTDLIGPRKRPFPKLPALVSPPGGYAGT